jgi:haloacetate dehalogenase
MKRGVMTWDAFSREFIDVAAGRVFVRRAGSGPVVLLLHGYPETNVAWRKVAPGLANEFTIVAADLPRYGESTVSDATRVSPIAQHHRTVGRLRRPVESPARCSERAGHDQSCRADQRGRQGGQIVIREAASLIAPLP